MVRFGSPEVDINVVFKTCVWRLYHFLMHVIGNLHKGHETAQAIHLGALTLDVQPLANAHFSDHLHNALT